MTTPREFLERFFQEKLAVYAEANQRLAPVYGKYFGKPLSDHAGDFLLLYRVHEVIDEVNESQGSAMIAASIKSERWPTARLRSRYHLELTGADWKIIRIDRECLRCRGTGQAGAAQCRQCGGEGWCDRRTDPAQQS